MMPSRAVKYVPRFCLPTTSSTQFVRRKPVDAVAWAYKWRNMSRVPSLQGRSRSTVGRPLDDYDRLMTSHSGPRVWTYSPSFDIRETEDAYHLEGKVPGVQSSDIDVEFEDSHRVNIKGHSSREFRSSEGSWWVSERSVGEFRRTFNFPSAIDRENTHTQLKDGILSITVTKSGSAANTKKVDVDT
ncbi:hypothetical protein N7471_001935 [Penicillium samsonianum]|uniref:uncharacterized protein n=1 Tax=Penicillium samsonianum TaxID=1882272 RepID=UPI0025485666|nr:uncharacterized protein N7471_001935 [Penicillium samsonianum]KAJ6142482.1 hypothetical protein N7471_001935 [Penicillium samsonianum]